MSKKYLSLEETAAALRMGTDEVIRLRERGGIRGFADRGTWKFREEDVLEVQRSRQADSDPDVPLLRDTGDSDSAILLVDELGEQPTIISKGDALTSSDSEVKLVGSLASDAGPAAPPLQPGLAGESDVRPLSLDSISDIKPVVPADSGVNVVEDVQGSDVRPISLGNDSKLGLGASDSSLQLAADSDSSVLSDNDRAGKLDSDSEVLLVAPSGPSLDSDSDVALVSESSAELEIGPLDDAMGSDSDVRLVLDAPKKKGSDSDVKLVKPGQGRADSDSDVALLREDDESIALDFTPDDGPGASVLADESGIALVGDDSAMLLKGESGLSLKKPGDSSKVLQSEDSDEGITLDIGGDSGISLEAAADSGISLESVADSGISLEDSIDFGGTVPMMKALGKDDDETAFEIPALKSDDSAFELSATGDSDAETAVFDLAEAEAGLDDGVFDVDDDTGEDEFAGMGPSEDELEVGDDVLGEDDELDDLDVFDADEDVFDEGATTGGQKFAAPVGAVAVEQDWGAGTFVSLIVATSLLVVVGLVMFDLVHNLWAYQQPTAASSMLLETLGGIYGK